MAIRRHWRDTFWAKAAMPLDELGCWQWTGSKNTWGYGRIDVNYEFGLPMRKMAAHRAAWMIFRGDLPPKPLVLDHLCRNRACVNPYHLEAVTTRENLARGEGLNGRNLRKTSCPYGHPYSGDNLRVYRAGMRSCRECTNARMRRIRREKAVHDHAQEVGQ